MRLKSHNLFNFHIVIIGVVVSNNNNLIQNLHETDDQIAIE